MEGKDKKQAKNKTPKVSPPAYSARSGPIEVAVWEKQSLQGYQYFDMTISRSFKRKNSEKWEKSTAFFERNAKDIYQAFADASAWIRAQEEQIEAESEVAATTEVATDAEPNSNGVALARIQPIKVPASEAIPG